MDNGAQRRGPITPAYDIAAKILLIGEAGVGKVQFAKLTVCENGARSIRNNQTFLKVKIFIDSSDSPLRGQYLRAAACQSYSST